MQSSSHSTCFALAINTRVSHSIRLLECAHCQQKNNFADCSIVWVKMIKLSLQQHLLLATLLLLKPHVPCRWKIDCMSGFVLLSNL